MPQSLVTMLRLLPLVVLLVGLAPGQQPAPRNIPAWATASVVTPPPTPSPAATPEATPEATPTPAPTAAAAAPPPPPPAPTPVPTARPAVATPTPTARAQAAPTCWLPAPTKERCAVTVTVAEEWVCPPSDCTDAYSGGPAVRQDTRPSGTVLTINTYARPGATNPDGSHTAKDGSIWFQELGSGWLRASDLSFI